MSSVRSSFIWNASYQVVRIIIPLITIPYLSRVLGAELLGTFSYTFTVANYFTLFVLLGLNQYGVRQLAVVRSNGKDESREFCSIFAMQLGTGAIVSSIYLGYVFFCPPSLRLISAIWFIWVISESFDVAWLFFGREQFRLITVRNFAVRLATVVLIFLFVRDRGDFLVYCLLQAAGNAISCLILWPMLKGSISFSRPSWPDVRRHIKPNVMLFAPIVAIACYTQLDKLFLGSMSSMAEVGYFDASEKISTIPLAVIQALGTVMLPHVSRLAASGEDGAAKRSVGNSVWLSGILSIAFMFGIAGVAKQFVPVFFGPGYEPVVTMMPLLSVIIPIVAWSNVLGIQCLLPYGRDRQYLVSVLAGAAVNIFLNVLLIPVFHGMGAVAAVIASELTVTLVQVLYLREGLPLGRWLLDSAPFAAIGLAMFVAVRSAGEYLGASVLGLVLQVALGAAVYALLSLAWLLVTHDERLSLFEIPLRKGRSHGED